jgi:hypothetical protein
MNISLLFRLPFTRHQLYVERLQDNTTIFGLDAHTCECVLYVGRWRFIADKQ